MRKIFLIMIFIFVSISLFSGDVVENRGNIIMIVAPENYMDEEFQIPYDYLKSKGYDVIVASRTTDSITGMLGGKIKPDLLIKNIIPDSFNVLVIPGGSGASVFFNDTLVKNIVLKFNRDNKIISAICLSPVTLAKFGVLKGKNATVWPSAFTKGELEKYGAKYKNNNVVIDGNIITGDGPKSSLEFAKAIDSLIILRKEADNVK